MKVTLEIKSGDDQAAYDELVGALEDARDSDIIEDFTILDVGEWDGGHPDDPEDDSDD